MRRSTRRACLALLALAACRSVPVGHPAPDALSIVEGTAGADVHPDTIDAPFAVSIARGRWQVRQGADPRRDFWSDVAVLDMVGAERAAASLDERSFVLGLRTLMQGDPEAAAIVFSMLRLKATDPLVRVRARVGLTMALSWHSDWRAIADLGAMDDSIERGDEDPIVAQASVERWAHAFADLPPAVVTLPESPVTLPLRRSAFGTPVITVLINGHPHDFWLDTGASMTLLSTSVAQESGVSLASGDTLALGVVAGHVEARAILIDSLRIGPIVARGLTAALVSPSVLRLDRRIVNGLNESVRIDGVIGTDLLRYMDLLLDAGDGTITIRRPHPVPHPTRNLFWVGYPVVRLAARDGHPMLFGLDTGAEGSFVTTSLLRKLPSTPVSVRRGSLGGLGEGKQETDWVVRDIAFSDGDYAITLRNTPVVPERRWTFVTFDGVIGSDVALGSRLHLDFANGVFDIRPR
ncbi:MAG: hypothetical protein JWN53_2127 [Gemmatimonadetes bacterium]|nr:hypothetical protein [Gemmatimonadota bacterium]